jgi:hypothetical protein
VVLHVTSLKKLADFCQWMWGSFLAMTRTWDLVKGAYSPRGVDDLERGGT